MFCIPYFVIIKQNTDLFSSISDCKIIKQWPTKKNPQILQAILQLNVLDYTRVIKNDYLFIGSNVCKVYKVIEILRCFQCNGFNHSKNNCKNQLSCPVCSKSHNLDNCPSGSQHQCVNCLSIKLKQKVDINTNHTVWDYENCYAYKKAIDKFKLMFLVHVNSN